MNLLKRIIVKTLLTSLGLFLITSCECSRSAKGVIIDETTQLPMDSVRVEGLTISLYHIYSDSVGKYFISTKMTGAVGGCPDYKVSYSKEGYQTQVVVNPEKSNIFMRPN